VLAVLLVALPLVVPLADLQVSEEVIQDHLLPEQTKGSFCDRTELALLEEW
jgi:hypothetical protein